MRSIPPSSIDSDHGDYEILSKIEGEILVAAKGKEDFKIEFPLICRKAIDNVIDAGRKNRSSFQELEKTEKAHIGTEMEILIREFLDVPRGYQLDLLIGGTEVDVKNTTGQNWMIPTEAVNHVVFLVAEDEEAFRCFAGLMIAKEAYLNKGKNRDAKRTVSAEGKANILWLLRDFPYPPNFWARITDEEKKHIMGGSSGNEKVCRLFRQHQDLPIPRNVIEAVCRGHKDPLKRVRKNGGARDKLATENIAILSGSYDQSVISGLDLPSCSNEEFVSHSPKSEKEKELLKKNGHLA